MDILNLSNRDKKLSNNAKKSRRDGNIPGILFDNKSKQYIFNVKEVEFNRIISNNRCNNLLTLLINGKEKRALIKNIQRDVISKKILHIDLEEIKQDEKKSYIVPINFIGETTLKDKGLILKKEIGGVKVKCLEENLPNYINLDLSFGLNGYSYRVGDLEFESEITIENDLDKVIAILTRKERNLN